MQECVNASMTLSFKNLAISQVTQIGNEKEFQKYLRVLKPRSAVVPIFVSEVARSIS